MQAHRALTFHTLYPGESTALVNLFKSFQIQLHVNGCLVVPRIAEFGDPKIVCHGVLIYSHMMLLSHVTGTLESAFVLEFPNHDELRTKHKGMAKGRKDRQALKSLTYLVGTLVEFGWNQSTILLPKGKNWGIIYRYSSRTAF
eukprot:896659-Amphidinium_carterae.1